MELFANKLDNTQRQPCEIWSRAMGYMRPTSNFNPGKHSEFKDRRYFLEDKALAAKCDKLAKAA